jgi:hypothetical protein
MEEGERPSLGWEALRADALGSVWGRHTYRVRVEGCPPWVLREFGCETLSR